MVCRSIDELFVELSRQRSMRSPRNCRTTAKSRRRYANRIFNYRNNWPTLSETTNYVKRSVRTRRAARRTFALTFVQEVETALKKKELELRLTEASLEQSHTLLTERTELIKQERQVVSDHRQQISPFDVHVSPTIERSRTFGLVQKMRRIGEVRIESSFSSDDVLRTVSGISKCHPTEQPDGHIVSHGNRENGQKDKEIRERTKRLSTSMGTCRTKSTQSQ
jgi:hypothetical protein